MHELILYDFLCFKNILFVKINKIYRQILFFCVLLYLKGMIKLMKRLVCFFIPFICVFIVCFSAVYAVDIEMNIDNNVNSENIIDSSNDDNNFYNSIGSSNSVKVSTTGATEDFTLSISDIIDIILIAVGIVLIFLAIAILLKIR